MASNNVKNFVTLYDIEAENFGEALPKDPTPSFFWLMIKATGIFITITLIVFFITNYQYIRSQIVDWRQGRGAEEGMQDFDGDGLPGWWEEKYGLDDENPKDALLDHDNDKANNLLEYRFGTNPLVADTDGDGYIDGEEIINGYNPNGEGKIDSDFDGLPDWWEEKNSLDKNDPSDAAKDPDNDGVSNKDEFKYLSDPQNMDTDGDGYADGDEISLGLNPAGEGRLEKTTVEPSEKDRDGDGLENFWEEFFGTDSDKKDTDEDGFSDLKELNDGYDPTGTGMIQAVMEIPSISVSVPIVWSQSQEEEKIQADLENGVVHYPGTPFPGLKGNSYLTGHSSYYSWSKSLYKTIFKDLGKLNIGEVVLIKFSLANGRNLEMVFRTNLNEVVDTKDTRLFRDYEGNEITLVTCWPIGTDWKRLMIKAELEEPKFH